MNPAASACAKTRLIAFTLPCIHPVHATQGRILGHCLWKRYKSTTNPNVLAPDLDRVFQRLGRPLKQTKSSDSSGDTTPSKSGLLIKPPFIRESPSLAPFLKVGEIREKPAVRLTRYTAQDSVEKKARAVREFKSYGEMRGRVRAGFVEPVPESLLQVIRSGEEDHSEIDAELLERGWETGWGQDELRPTGSIVTPVYEKKESDTTSVQGEKKDLPKIPFEDLVSPFAYTRRIEGVVEPDDLPQPFLQDIPPPSPQLPVAHLEHGLERVIFNPGVHWLQDPRSRVYNFDPYLQEVPEVTDFAFERLQGFIKSSLDPDLATIAEQEDRMFSGSTSSISGMLCHLYFLISGDHLVDTSTLSRAFQWERRHFTPGQRMPSVVVFNYKDGRYAIDSSSEKDAGVDKNILIWMGTVLEKFLTMPKEEFATYRRSYTDPPPTENKTMREAFRFSKSNKFVLRSQLDCRDSRLPGTGVFDIKTRACMPIRLDLMNFVENSGYLIRKQHGLYESFEREYYDLIRSAFLKYQFQARIGNMDGVLVAYHNTAQMFGFQYVPLEEMDECLFGPGKGIGDRMFGACLNVLENVAEEVVSCFPKESVSATFETLEGSGKMNVWVEPLKWDGEPDEKPIKQLQIQTWNYSDSTSAKPVVAFRDVENRWSLRWAVSHLSSSMTRMRRSLGEARERQFRAWAIPSGMDPGGLKEWYENLNFGGQGESGSEFNPERFVGVDRKLKRLRRLAREGRKDTERLRELEEGKPRHVLGWTDVI